MKGNYQELMAISLRRTPRRPPPPYLLIKFGTASLLRGSNFLPEAIWGINTQLERNKTRHAVTLTQALMGGTPSVLFFGLLFFYFLVLFYFMSFYFIFMLYVDHDWTILWCFTPLRIMENPSLGVEPLERHLVFGDSDLS